MIEVSSFIRTAFGLKAQECLRCVEVGILKKVWEGKRSGMRSVHKTKEREKNQRFFLIEKRENPRSVFSVSDRESGITGKWRWW